MEYDLLNLILESTTKSLFEIKTVKHRGLLGASLHASPALKFSPELSTIAPSSNSASNYKPGGLLSEFSQMNRGVSSSFDAEVQGAKGFPKKNSIDDRITSNQDAGSLLGQGTKSRVHKSMDTSSRDADGDAFNQIISKINHSFQEMNLGGRTGGGSTGGSRQASGNTSISSNSFTSELTSIETQPKRPSSVGSGGHAKMTLEFWMSHESKRLLVESMRSLGISETDITKKDLSYKSHEELTMEKKKVKNELKSYDSLFIGHFSRTPSRSEKEPMRPLYVYYKRVKQALVRTKPGTAPGNSAAQGASNQPNRNTVSGSRAEPQAHGKSGVTNGGWVSSQLNVSSGDVKGKATGGYSSGNVRISSNPQVTQLRAKLDELNNLRSDLRDKLHKYQNEFVQLHSRKIKYHKDLIPIEKEYKMYKQVKLDIQDLETKLESLK